MEKVADAASFVDFLEVLSRDWYVWRAKGKVENPILHEYGDGDWVNDEFGDVLEAAVACWRASSKAGPAHAMPAKNPWQAAARIIYLGKYYE